MLRLLLILRLVRAAAAAAGDAAGTALLGAFSLASSAEALGQGDGVEHGDLLAIDGHQSLNAQVPQQPGDRDTGGADGFGNGLVGEPQVNGDSITTGYAKIPTKY
jgi:hypothetical protein